MHPFQPQQSLNFDVIQHIIHFLQVEKETMAPAPAFRPSVAYRLSCYTLLSFALSCHELMLPSLRALWRRQDHFLPLLKLLPQLRLSESLTFSLSGYSARFDEMNRLSICLRIIQIDEPVHVSDWNRFSYYAKMIQELYFSLTEHWFSFVGERRRIQDSVYTFLKHTFREGAMLPNLSILSLDKVVGAMLPIFHSSKLHCVTSSGEYTRNPFNIWASTFLKRASEISPNLQNVTLDSLDIQPSALQTILNNVPHLRTLQFRLTASDDLCRLFDEAPVLQHLERLHIFSSWGFQPWTMDRNDAPTGKPLRAPHLQTLLIQGTLELMARICESIGCGRLLSFTGIHPGIAVKRSQGVAYERIWRQISTLSSYDLEEVTLHAKGNVHGVTFDPISKGHLQHLYDLPKLRVVKFVNFIPFLPRNSDLERIGEAWPLLEELVIPLPATMCAPQITLHGVKALAERCPRLGQLDLTFDAYDPSTIPSLKSLTSADGDSKKISTGSLWRLFVNDSILHYDCIEPLSDLLKYLFPNLISLSNYGKGRDSMFWPNVRSKVLN